MPAEKPVEEGGSEACAYGVLTALHADVINFFGVAAYVSGHKVVEEKAHVVKLQQVAVLEIHVLLF